MTYTAIIKAIESPLPARLVALAAAAALFLYLRGKDAESQAGAFLIAVLLLAVRDLASAFIELPGLSSISDTLYLGLALWLLGERVGVPKPALLSALAFDLAIVALTVFGAVSGLGSAAPAWTYALAPLANAAAIAAAGLYSARRAGRIGRKDAPAPGRAWIASAAMLFAYAALGLVLGHGDRVFARLVVPASYLWLSLVGLADIASQYGDAMSAISYYEESIDALYNLYHRVGTVFKGGFNTEDVIGGINDAMIAETGASGGSIYLVDEFEDAIAAKACSGVFPPPFPLPEGLPRKQNRVESYMRHARFKLGETVLGEVAATGKSVFVPDVHADGRFPKAGDEEFLRLSSFMAVPLMADDAVIGVAAYAKTLPGSRFGETDFDRLKLLANFGTLFVSNYFSYVAANEKSGIERSAGIAAEIQRTMLPKKLPQLPGLGVGAFSAPARGVSGDYYDVIRPREDRVVGIVGDVAGKGVSAALVMVMIRSILHLVTSTDRDMATVLDWVNRGITGKVDLDHYATIGLVGISVETGELDYANAGHQPLLVYRRADGTFEAVEGKSVPIGIERTTKFRGVPIRLGDGDMAILYTDGIVEAMNPHGRQFGRKGLTGAILKYKDLEPKDMAAKIKAELAAFVGGARQHDDQTVLILKKK